MNWVSIGSNNGMSPIRRQAIIWTNVGLLSIGPLATNFSEFFFIKIQNFSFTKMLLNILSVKWWPFCLVGDEINNGDDSTNPSLCGFILNLVIHQVSQPIEIINEIMSKNECIMILAEGYIRWYLQTIYTHGHLWCFWKSLSLNNMCCLISKL